MFESRSLVTVLTLTALVSAQSLSPSCQSAFITVGSNTDSANCLNPSALLNVITQPDDSIISPVNQWLTGLCAAGPCSNATLSTVLNTVARGCSTELNTLGVSLDDSTQNLIKEAYPTWRKVFCLKDTGANQFCVPEVMTDIQNAVGTLSVSNIASIVAKGGPNTSIPTNASCGTCSKAAYTIVKQDFPSAVQGIDTSSCGADFTDGQTPSGIALTASDDGSSGSAIKLSSTLALTTSSLALLLTVFTIFA